MKSNAENCQVVREYVAQTLSFMQKVPHLAGRVKDVAQEELFQVGR